MLEKQKAFSPFAILIIANVLMGTNLVVFKIGLEHLHPLLFAGIYYAAMGALMMVLYRKRIRLLRSTNHISKILVNTLLITATMCLWVFGLDYSSGLKAGLLSLSIPLFVYLLSILYLHEQIIKRALYGCLLGLAGSVIMVGLPSLVNQPLEAGDLLLLASYFLYAVLIVHSKHLYKTFSVAEVLSYRFLIGGVVLLGYAIFAQGATGFAQVPASGWIAIGYVVTIGGLLAVTLFYWALSKMEAETTAPVLYLNPMTAAIGSVILLGDRLDLAMIIGAMVIITGLYISHPYHTRVFHRMHKFNEDQLHNLKHWLQKEVKVG